VEFIRTPHVRDVRDPKPNRERIVLVEVLWNVSVDNQIFTLGVGSVVADPEDICVCF